MRLSHYPSGPFILYLPSPDNCVLPCNVTLRAIFRVVFWPRLRARCIMAGCESVGMAT